MRGLCAAFYSSRQQSQKQKSRCHFDGAAFLFFCESLRNDFLPRLLPQQPLHDLHRVDQLFLFGGRELAEPVGQAADRRVP